MKNLSEKDTKELQKSLKWIHEMCWSKSMVRSDLKKVAKKYGLKFEDVAKMFSEVTCTNFHAKVKKVTIIENGVKKVVYEQK